MKVKYHRFICSYIELMMDTDIKARILRHDRPAPRYTSYPPAPFFSRDFQDKVTKHWLLSLQAEQTISLYIHIPFCAQLCYYCGCHTVIANQYDRITAYLNQLRQEILMVSAKIADGVKVTHIHFGGGSPTMLQDEDFESLIQFIRNSFTIDPGAEFAIEADPRQINPSKLNTYARCGVTRLSLGVQDFDQHVLELVNRKQPYELTEQAVKAARDAGIKGINFDIMYGLPGQTLDTMKDTMARVIDLAPDRVSFFGYAHVPWLKKHMRVIGQENLPDSDLRYDLSKAGKAILTKAGYHQIGIDHFVKDSDPMYDAWVNHRLYRNFQGYTTDAADALIGLGASAISRYPQGYSQNMTDLRAYADAISLGRLPVARGYVLTDMDMVHADIIYDLMCYMTVDLTDIAMKHIMPVSLLDECMDRLAPLVDEGLIHIDGTVIKVSENAPHMARLAAMAFDQYTAQENTQRHSSAV